MTTFVFATVVPDVLPSTSSWELVTNSRIFQSPLTNAVQTAARKGAHWKISLTFENLFGEDRANMQAFLAGLEGQEHRFTIKDHSFTRRGTGATTGWTTDASPESSGNSLRLQNSGTVTTSIAKGDYISTDNQLFMATAATSVTNGSELNVTVAPATRSITSGQSVELVNPVGVFMMTGSTGWDTKPGIMSTFRIEAIEDVLA